MLFSEKKGESNVDQAERGKKLRGETAWEDVVGGNHPKRVVPVTGEN